MRRLLTFLSRLCHSPHLFGLFIAFAAFMTIGDLLAVKTIIPWRMGFRWQAEFVATTPIVCIIGCVIVFLLSPVANRSRFALIRGVGRIPVLGRYWVCAGIVCGVGLVAMLSLNLLTSSSIQSLTLPVNISGETWTRIEQEVGEGVTYESSRGVTRVFFLKEKRAAVQRAIQNDHITAE